MASIITIKDGVVSCVYDDRLLPLFQALGSIEIARATEVEFDHGAQEWVATHIESGQIIARGTNRSLVIQQEVEWLERHVILQCVVPLASESAQ